MGSMSCVDCQGGALLLGAASGKGGVAQECAGRVQLDDESVSQAVMLAAVGAGSGREVHRPGAAGDIGAASFVYSNCPPDITVAAANKGALIQPTAIRLDLHNEGIAVPLV